MYQQELFGGLAAKQGKYLGSGMFANAYKMSDGNVCKVARDSDGTRNWLEFCAAHTAAGTLKPLMPEVFSVIPCEEGYMAIIPCYTPALEHGLGKLTSGIRSHPDYAVREQEFGDYLSCLAGRIVEVWDVFCDMHSGNYMWCARRGWVITDPSCAGYIKQEDSVLTLH